MVAICSGYMLDCKSVWDIFSILKCTKSVSAILFVAAYVATGARKCDRRKEFDCGNGVCIPASKVCDKKPDCPNFADEPPNKCFKSECKVNNGGCQDICVDTPEGFYCECKRGYQLASDGKHCEDVNECEQMDTCSQKCTNTEGGFKCECFDGYIRDISGTTLGVRPRRDTHRCCLRAAMTSERYRWTTGR